MDEKKSDEKKPLVGRDHPKYDALVKAGLIDDPARLRKVQADEKAAVEAARKPKPRA